MALITTGADAKTRKGEKHGFRTAISYLAPHTEGTRKSVCPFSSPECRASCLYKAGRGRMPNVQAARLARTRLFAQDPSAYMARLHGEVADFVAESHRVAMTPAVRLNGTSDLRYELIPYAFGGRRFRSIMEAFGHVQFYDYTKYPVHLRTSRPENYHLTFSYSGRNMADASAALRHGMNVAVVFAKDLPERFTIGARAYDVIDGDVNDLRFLDPRGVVVGLRAKGPARKARSVFVVER